MKRKKFRPEIPPDVERAVAALAGMTEPQVNRGPYAVHLLREALLAGDRGMHLRAVHRAPDDVPAAFAETFGEPADQEVVP